MTLEKIETSKKINNIIKRIKSEKNQQKLKELNKKKEKLESKKWLREDPNGHLYKIKIEKKNFFKQ